MFIKTWDSSQCLSLRIDQHGQVDAPLALRSVSEIKELQAHAHTTIVLSTSGSSLYEVELSKLPDRKARAAIPYALEDELAQSVTQVHCSFDTRYYHDGRYLVVVTDRLFLTDLVTQLDAESIDFDTITLDWFALKQDELVVMPDQCLVYSADFKGALSGALIDSYWKNVAKDKAIFTFDNSMPVPKEGQIQPISGASETWIAERLRERHGINLAQGFLQHGKPHYSVTSWYQVAAALCLGFFLLIGIVKGAYLHVLHRDIASVDHQIADLYTVFFPEAKVVINPRFRISQWLKTGAGQGNAATLWSLLDVFSKHVQPNQVTIEQCFFQNQVLSITLVSPDFSVLERLQQALRDDHIHVMQSQASSHDKQVSATLELRL